MLDVVTVGEILIDLVATQPEVTLFDAPAFEPNPGGAPANVAVGVARLGKRAGFIGKVGADEFGQGLRQLLVREGVDVTGLLVDPMALTTLAIVALSATGDPHFAFAPGAHTRLHAAELPHELLRTTRIVQAGSVSLAHAPVRTATLTALQIARDAGAYVAYDLNWRPFLYQDQARDLALQIIQEPLLISDLVKLNAGELQLLTGESDPGAGLARLATSTPDALLIVTLGSQGCLAWMQGTLLHVAAPTVARVVDATGAGDAFMAAVLAGLPEEPRAIDPAALEPLLRRACMAGAIAVTRRGAIPALPTAQAIDAAIAHDHG